MNRVANFVALLLGTTIVGAFTAPSEASIDKRLEEEQACANALRRNTVAALENFLRKYPNGSSACRALALNALGGQSERAGQSGTPRDTGYNR